MKLKSGIIFFLFLGNTCLCQISIDDNIQFGKYLFGTKQYEDAIYLFQKTDLVEAKHGQIDTINFFLAKSYYQIKDFPHAISYFSRLHNTHKLMALEATYFEAYLYATIGEHTKAISTLNLVNTDSLVLNRLTTFEKAGTYLLQRNLKAFDELSISFDRSIYQFAQQEGSLLNIRQDLKEHKNKSPLLAGALSALIPGSGKIYAGKTGEGIVGLLINGILGLQTYEAYRKDGFQSARFWIFGSVFSFFYIGNIWGSVFTVKISNDEFNEAVNHQILFDMHIPLRTIFH